MTDVVIPVKDLSLAKGRLRDVLSGEERAGLVLAMLRDLLGVLRRCEIGDIWLVARDEDVFRLGVEYGAQEVREVCSTGYNQAVSAGLQAASEGRPVIVLPADLPLVQPKDITRLTGLETSQGPTIGIVPDRHNRGTNGLFFSAPDLIAPSFGPGSFFSHKVAAAQVGVSATVLPLDRMAMDVDCPDDLFGLPRSEMSGATAAFLNAISVRVPSSNWRSRGVA